MWGVRRGVAVVTTTMVLGAGASAARGDDAPVRAAFGDLTAAAVGVRDDQGTSLDALDVLQVGPGAYLGVHQALVDGRFEARLVSSSDLRSWHAVRRLARDEGMPSIAAAPGGGFVIATERASTLGLLPSLALPAEIVGPTRLWMLQKSQLRFRFYSSLDQLTSGRAARRFTAPRTLSPTNEGTPSLTAVRRTGARGVAGLRVEVGFHHFADLSGDGVPDADRQATGVLTGLRHWSARARPDLDAAVLQPLALHPGFLAAPTGSVGDRDDVTLPDGTTAEVTEAQYTAHDVATWRLFLRDPAGGPATPLVPRTPGGSAAVGNPTVTAVTLPDGRPALVVTAFVFGPGSAPGEAGELVAVHPLA